MLEPLYTAAEMRAAEAGHDEAQLMQRAGRAVAEVVLREFADARRVTVVCGPGNNGGDGRIAADQLGHAGKEVLVVDSKPEDAQKQLGDPDVIIDALFGTGFTGAPRPAAARLLEQMNAARAPIVAVDIASGVDASTGEVAGAAVEAHATVALHAAKVGSHVAPGRFSSGAVHVADIGLAHAETGHARVTTAILDAIPRRGARDTKYTAGSVLVVGGSRGMTGAAALAARAALRADAGYVGIAAPQEALPVLEALVVEAVKRPLGEVWDAVGRAGALALGPGLGRSDDGRALVHRLLEETDVPAVVDADALHELEPFDRRAATVLTPHSGELARLLGAEPRWVDEHRLEALRRAVDRFACVVVLKGSGTLVGAPGERVLVVDGPPALATAGTGDVLTGVVAAFLAKRLDAQLAAAAAVFVHARAAVKAGKQAGLVAGDVVESLPDALMPD